MARITVVNNLTLDGVMQGPGHPDEDRRDGFEHGGWAAPYADEVSAGYATSSMGTTGGLLLGRWTYEDLQRAWAGRTDNPFTPVLENSPKYVATRTLTEPLPWMNSIKLDGDVVDAVSKLRAEQEKDLVILGSGELIQALIARALIDEYTLLIHPIVLGEGRRLFRDGSAYSKLVLVDSKPTTTGVLIATYRPA